MLRTSGTLWSQLRPLDQNQKPIKPQLSLHLAPFLPKSTTFWCLPCVSPFPISATRGCTGPSLALVSARC